MGPHVLRTSYFERPYWTHPLISVASRHQHQISTCVGKDPALVWLHFGGSSPIGVLECWSAPGPPALSVISRVPLRLLHPSPSSPPTTMHYTLDTLPSSHFSNPAADCRYSPLQVSVLPCHIRMAVAGPPARNANATLVPASKSAAVSSALSTTDRQHTGSRVCGRILDIRSCCSLLHTSSTLANAWRSIL